MKPPERPDPSDSGRRRRRRGSWILEGLLVLALVGAVQAWRSHSLVRGEAPPLVATRIDGTRFDLARQRGQPVLVHFWATWCPACRLEEASLDSLAREFQVISLALHSGGAREIQDYLAKQGRVFPVIADEQGRLAAAWGVSGVPASFILDGAGRIRFATLGYSTELGLRARLWLAR